MGKNQYKGWVFASGKRLTGYEYSGASNTEEWYRRDDNFQVSEHSALKYTRHYNNYWTSEPVTFNKGQ